MNGVAALSDANQTACPGASKGAAEAPEDLRWIVQATPTLSRVFSEHLRSRRDTSANARCGGWRVGHLLLPRINRLATRIDRAAAPIGNCEC